MSIVQILKKAYGRFDFARTGIRMCAYYFRFKKYSFSDCSCESPEQFEASITRLYHTIEKGLSYDNYKPGFGKDNVDKLITSLEQYSNKGYDVSAFFYQTALACLDEYIKKNLDNGHTDKLLAERIKKIPGQPNGLGGTIAVQKPINTERMNFKELLTSRHSVRHFSSTSVDRDLIYKAIRLAQYTPSACNRQGWKTRIISDRKKINRILENQNGNRGFGHEFDKLLIITSDLRMQQKNRELFQAFIDGGMYAENIINALFFYGIAGVPLSASLTTQQERIVRNIAEIDDAEVLILFIGIGNYLDSCLTTRSERHKPVIINL